MAGAREAAILVIQVLFPHLCLFCGKLSNGSSSSLLSAVVAESEAAPLLQRLAVWWQQQLEHHCGFHV